MERNRLVDRVLAEPRILWSYAARSVLPFGERLHSSRNLPGRHWWTQCDPRRAMERCSVDGPIHPQSCRGPTDLALWCVLPIGRRLHRGGQTRVEHTDLDAG